MSPPFRHVEDLGLSLRPSISKYAADINEYRQRYGKDEGERRFFAEHTPFEVVGSNSPPKPIDAPSIPGWKTIMIQCTPRGVYQYPSQ